MNKTVLRVVMAAVVLVSLSACSHKVGSPEWCADMEKKPKAEWSMNEMKDVAKYCVFGATPEK